MSLIRSFTTRRGKSDQVTDSHIGRVASQRTGKPISRAQISSPVALVSSSNPLSFNAPNISGTSRIQFRNISTGSSTTSSHSAEDSDASTLSIESHTDASSVEDSSPISPEPEPNHLSCYFKSASTSPSESTRTSFDAPIIPSRVPSHSKKAHERVHRKRSVKRMMSPPISVTRRESTEMFQPVEAPRENPFGNELAQLDEVAEDLSSAVRDAEAEADAQYMRSHNLAYFGASDYLSEIQGLLNDIFPVQQQSWI